MNFLGENGPDDIVGAMVRGIKDGLVIGKWLGTAAGAVIAFVLKFIVIFIAAGIGAMGDFVRRFVAGWKG